MKLYGLIGYPLGHSFSKQYFTEKFKKEGHTDCLFESFPIPAIEEFESLIKNHPSLRGIAVTIPYKEQVLRYVEELSEEVKAIGATNSIKVNGNKLVAYNTDIAGFEQSFKKLLKPWHTKALVLGTGGASKAVQYVLGRLNIVFSVVTRAANKGDNLITYEAVTEDIVADHKIIINCTPVGMWPNIDAVPNLPYHAVTPAHYLYDLVYKPEKTLFLAKGEEKGATIQNGYEMLLIQAEVSWKIWNELI